MEQALSRNATAQLEINLPHRACALWPFASPDRRKLGSTAACLARTDVAVLSRQNGGRQTKTSAWGRVGAIPFYYRGSEPGF